MPGATPIYGIPYALTSDSPHGPNQEEAIAAAVEAALAALNTRVLAIEAAASSYGKYLGGAQRDANSGNITGTETIFATSGSVALPDNSAFLVRASCNYFISVAGDEFDWRIHETNLAGNAIKTHFADSVEFAGVPKTYEYFGFYKTTAAEPTKTFVASVKRTGGSGNIVAQAGSAVLVFYLGPSSLLATLNP
ncbi:MAG: hypothetical protein HOQ21_09830 [Dermatophilaceae bacterium]|nr:hypothetical protein [Dermatophilaceae bacterium]